MAVATSNRLLPVLASAVLLMLGFVTLKSCSDDLAGSLIMDRIPQAPAPDADTPADTIKTLTANVAAMTTEVEALRQDNAGLRRENQALLRNRTQIEENVTTRVQRELLAREKDAANRARIDSGVLSSLTARVDALAASLNEAQANYPASDIPVGFGLNGARGAATDAIVWIEPLDASQADGEGGLLDRAKAASGGLFDTTRSGTASAIGGIEDRLDRLQPGGPDPGAGPGARPDALQGHHRRRQPGGQRSARTGCAGHGLERYRHR